LTWESFLSLPERAPSGQRYELHDGVPVTVPLRPPSHKKLQKRIERLLETLAGGRGVVTTEFPYRPVVNLQYWVADVAFIPQADWDALPLNDYPIYSPPLIVEVLSPSNTTAKIDRQRIVAMSSGTQEFWVVDPERRTVQVTNLNGTKTYAAEDAITFPMFSGSSLTIDQLFRV